MFSIDEVKKKREIYERKIEDILIQFEKELSSEIRIENMVAIRPMGTNPLPLKCSIKLVVEDLNK